MKPPLAPAATSAGESGECSELPGWQSYFNRKETLCIERSNGQEDKFCVYRSGNCGPLVVFMHGAGHTALSWSLVAQCLMTMSKMPGPVQIAAYDCRGHGETSCVNSKDLSAETLIDDGARLISKMVDEIEAQNSTISKVHSTSKSRPPVVLVGHSMGGAIATKIAAGGTIDTLAALIVLDVVEGVALAALPQMLQFVRRFPKTFASQTAAIDWMVQHRIISNKRSAEISIPSQLIRRDDGLWCWRVDVEETQPLWRGWFEGTSACFLGLSGSRPGPSAEETTHSVATAPRYAKILVLAGASGDVLVDKTLTIAQMEGKFQLTVVPKTGHIIEEDQPQAVADVITSFLSRYKFLLY